LVYNFSKVYINLYKRKNLKEQKIKLLKNKRKNFKKQKKKLLKIFSKQKIFKMQMKNLKFAKENIL